LAFEKNNKNGRHNIIESLRFSNQDDNKKLFDICRAILRHAFGSIQERGKKGIYQDVPFAITWWRIYLSKEISKRTTIDEAKIYKYFDENPTNYNELIMRMSSKLTVIADKNIRDGFFKYFIENNITDTKNFRQIIRIIGIESSWRAMGSLSIEDNKKIIESLVA
jgi:lysyl-tRNA synthetase class I